jgi:hypothetical protein
MKGSVRVVGNELLKGMVVEVLVNSDNVSATPSNILNADKDVGIGTPQSIGEPEEVLQQLRLDLETGLDEAVLISLEIKSVAFFLVEKNFEESSVHPLESSQIGWTSRSSKRSSKVVRVKRAVDGSRGAASSPSPECLHHAGRMPGTGEDGSGEQKACK